jgi:hypothetical protein
LGTTAAAIIVAADLFGIGGVLGLLLVVLVIGWLVYGHVGGLYL